MPKKSANTRGGASRNRPRPQQKSVQLVRPVPAEGQSAVERDGEETASAVATTTAAEPVEKKAGSRRRVPSTVSAPSSRVVDEPVTKTTEETDTAEAINVTGAAAATEVTAPRSASARMAARRKAAQNVQTRRSENLITAEHYAYVRRDLIFIAILAFLMLATLVVLHFVPGIGS